MDLLVASLLALVVAALLRRPASHRRASAAALDGFVLVAVSGFVLAQVFPRAAETAGWGAVAAGLAGVVLPALLHRTARGRSHAIEAALALAGVGVHALLENAGTTSPVVLGALEAAIGGTLLHVVVFHEPGGGWLQGPGAAASVLGAIAALGLLFVLGKAHPHEEPVAAGELGAGTTFRLLALDSAPPLLLAFVSAGLAQTFLGHASLAWLGRGSSVSQAVRGIAFGVPLPLCSCGVVPVYRSVIGRGASVAAALAFLVSAPEIGIDSVLLSVPLLGGSIAVARVVCAATVALVTGVVVSRFASAHAVPRSLAVVPERTPSVPDRFVAGLRLGVGEVVDHNLPWILVGLVVGALVEPAFRAHAMASLPPGVDVPALALLGVPSYVCAAGATPLMAVLRHKGLSAGAAIAFLLTGPATNLTTLGMLSRIHGRRVAAAFALVVGGAAIGLGYAVNAALPDAPAIPLHDSAKDAPGAFASACVVLLAFLGLASLFRQGVRGFLGQVMGGEHVHQHGGHEHGQDVSVERRSPEAPPATPGSIESDRGAPAAPSASRALEVSGLTVRLGGRDVIRGLGFSVETGRSLAVIGPNGAGKTVLFRALIGAIPSEGSVRWAPGTRIGYVPQKLDIERDLPLTGRDFLRAKAAVARRPLEEIATKLALVDLDADAVQKPIGALSGGQFQRLLLAFALMGDPNVLLLDELTAGVDEPGQRRLNELVHGLRVTTGLTTLQISHDLSVVFRDATDVLCLEEPASFGPPIEVLTPEALERLYGAPTRFHRHGDGR